MSHIVSLLHHHHRLIDDFKILTKVDDDADESRGTDVEDGDDDDHNADFLCI